MGGKYDRASFLSVSVLRKEYNFRLGAVLVIEGKDVVVGLGMLDDTHQLHLHRLRLCVVIAFFHMILKQWHVEQVIIVVINQHWDMIDKSGNRKYFFVMI